ncbi:MAG: nucleoside monophosphate kinase [Candidatus Omnitrophica bacterium]|nr:nucleoside monophosphate kinase [Candidatus Omnitrophota bacterium]
MRIILFGAPGSGKGTQAQALAEYYKIKRICVGDILRQEVNKGSSFGKMVKSYMEKGLLVPDELILDLIKKNIDNKDFILDGYPRNLSQAAQLEKLFSEKNIDTYVFVYLYVDRETIINRLSKRLICQDCGANYHLINMPPKKDKICDICKGNLIQRKDDTPKVIRKRWEVFLKESKPLLDFYKKKDKFIKIDAKAKKDIVFSRIIKLLDKCD